MEVQEMSENPLGPEKRAPRYWETSDFWKDAGERIVSTYLFFFVALLVVTEFDFTNSEAWGGAAIAAAFSTLKALIGAQRKDSTTPVSIL
jgi:hypothetical protein